MSTAEAHIHPVVSSFKIFLSTAYTTQKCIQNCGPLILESISTFMFVKEESFSMNFRELFSLSTKY